ncbi:hypothetical protein SPRG_11858 [Saprolegnia parasitica CBS 223.65]|uniref:CRAL-TRIO domain-containing protein n=1 Tax=Saprolegnia parasitica (strain CBS 223.65) TaxID=695850 RepID=A0A067C862_SAPPC|nr:hypothetical protein SPRG_11858 [Saprolegnia parasitica CBS 223.65]KDO23012.1 hypothetical protein SPRG_11858 [Saprolegnia parasitica CBS 223.65]|eukprot:XP_012206300.1 hypothetical protein SPRG_11858 [Saprolegnia parasitica CBS 223.65]
MFKKLGFGRRTTAAPADLQPAAEPLPALAAIDDRPSTFGNVAQYAADEAAVAPEDMAALQGIDFDVDVNAVDMAIEAPPVADPGSDWNGCGGCPVSMITDGFVPPALRALVALFCARTRTDNKNLVVYEHVGGLNKALEALEAQHEIAFADVMAHYLFLTEFQWARLDTRPFDKATPTLGQMVKILDFQGMTLSDCKNADFRTFVSWTMRTIGQHYPERCAAIYIINTPPWFNTFWLVIQRLISDVTKQKIRICPAPKDYVRRLTAWLGPDHLPALLGGNATHL